VDLFPPGPYDPQGIHGAIRQQLDPACEPHALPPAEPLTLAGYLAGTRLEAFVEHLLAGSRLPEMPLFLQPDRYVNVLLEDTYMSAYPGMPGYWREVLEGRAGR
jgi:hypothetical protein